jgi:hypothetical protein
VIAEDILIKLIKKILAIPVLDVRSMEISLINQCLTLALANREKKRISSLIEVEFRGFSQWGEDGILDWLVERIPGIPEIFVEFGVENYREANTRLLLWLRNWRGLVIDGSPSNIEDIRNQEVSWRFDLETVSAFIDCDNINELISSNGFNGDIGILSVDIDGNDYWVWQSISVINPVIVVCEYNAIFGDLRQITTPYRSDFQRALAHYSWLYFGASLQALIDLGSAKGYSFVGTNSNGCNAFFVRNDRAPDVLGALDGISSCGSLFRESRDKSGGLSYIRGRERVESIYHMPVYDLELKRELPLAEIGDLYSDNWKKRYG